MALVSTTSTSTLPQDSGYDLAASSSGTNTNTSTWTLAQYQSATAASIAALTTAQVQGLLRPDWLLPAAVAGFTAQQIPYLTVNWNLFGTIWLNALSSNAVSAITSTQIKQITATALAGLDAAHTTALSAAQVSSLSSSQIAALGYPQNLSTAAVTALTTAQISAIPAAKWTSFSATWLNATSTTVFASIPAVDVAQWANSAVAGLDGAHTSSLAAIQVAALSPAQIPYLSNVAALSTAAVAALSSTQLAALSASQLPALSISQVSALSLTQLQALGSNVQYLSKAACAALSDANLLGICSKLCTSQLAYLSSSQKKLVEASLLAGLTTSGIRNSVYAVLNAGQSLYTYSSLLKVLDGVRSTIGSTGLSSTQLRELGTLTKLTGMTLGMNAYLFDLCYNVVTYNSANAYWTRNGTTTALGNLSVGSSAAKMGLLVDKWFRGRDLPLFTTGSVTYLSLANTTPLFTSAGPLASDVKQGNVADSYLLATAAAIANEDPGFLKSMFTDNGNGTYGVRFFDNFGYANYVTVDTELPSMQITGMSATKASWVALLEKAYVQFEVRRYGLSNSYASLTSSSANCLYDLTGKQYDNYISAGYAGTALWEQRKSTIVTALNSGQEVLYSSYKTLADPSNGKVDLTSGVVYTVLDYNSSRDTFTLRDPWGHTEDTSCNITFELNMAQLWGGASGTAAKSGFMVTRGTAPTGTMSSNSVDQLIQALAMESTSGAADSLGSLLPEEPQPILLAAAI